MPSAGPTFSIASCWGFFLSKIMRARMLALLLMPLLASAARLKDIVDIEGVRQNQLIGYGLVVGLAGTGDKQTTVRLKPKPRQHAIAHGRGGHA